ncbi:MAG: nonstructural protein [Microviridae sp.]|nr:MAG: nonstructural protein [Microviridae sp.]
MQVQSLFTVYDEAAHAFLPPFFVPHIDIAKRAFKDCINSDTHQFGKHPDQYTLFHLGEFNDQDAQFQLTDKQSLGNGVEYLDLDHIDSLGDFRNGQNTTPVQPDQDS